MWNFNEVKAVTYRDGYTLHVVFDDGLEGDLDLTEYIGRGPVFEPLRDQGFFRTARVENGTVSWPNGADIAPETLYDKLAAVQPAHAPVMGVSEPKAAYGDKSGGSRRKKRT